MSGKQNGCSSQLLKIYQSSQIEDEIPDGVMI